MRARRPKLGPLALDRDSYVPSTLSSGWARGKPIWACHDEIQAASAKPDASIAGNQDSVSTGVAQCAHLDIVLQLIVANQATQGDASRDNRNARERLLQKS